MNLAIGGDGRVNLHEIGTLLSFENLNTLDLKLGFVDFALCNLGDSNKDSKAQCQLNSSYLREHTLELTSQEPQ